MSRFLPTIFPEWLCGERLQIRNARVKAQVRLDWFFIEEHHSWCSSEETSVPPNDDHASMLTHRGPAHARSTEVHGCAMGFMHGKNQRFLNSARAT